MKQYQHFNPRPWYKARQPHVDAVKITNIKYILTRFWIKKWRLDVHYVKTMRTKERSESGEQNTHTSVEWNVILYANVTLPLSLVSNKLNLPFFSTLFQWIKIVTASKCTFEETMPKLSVNFGNHISQDSHNNQYSAPVCNFGFTVQQMLIKFAAELPYLFHW